MASKTSGSTSLKEYLKRYEANNEEDKKKKKKKKKTKPDALGVLVVDEDPVWQKPVNLEEENGDDSADEEKPQIEEDIEVKRMKRLEQLRSRRPYNVISEDGSGWVPISDAPKLLNSDDQTSDMSPPRKWRARYDTPSPEPELKPSESGRDATDLSPPRQRRRARYDTPSPEPELKPLESGRDATDLSPPRQRRKHYNTPSPEPEPEIKSSHSTGFNPDISPPRRRRPQTSTDKKRKNSEEHEMPDISPPRRVRRSPSYQDVLRASSGADLSPPRKNRKDIGRPGSTNISQQSHRYSIEDEVSDLSPPRKSRKELSSLKERPKTGLVTGQDIKEDISKTKKDDWLRFKGMDPSISGRGAEPVYRDKIKGERISKDEFLKSQKGEEKPKEKKLEWGKGLAQKREAEARQQELELEKDKPFARTRDDPELDEMLKERVRWGDPMAHLVKKKQSELVLPNLGDSGKMKESGFIIPQDIPNHSWIKLGLDAAPNRYGIRPGRHWDGVDRSNGYEKGLFKRMNEKQATEKEAYLWSVSDM
ncbi:hypothetical protein L1049_027135 [Liquidambar formosana]|uniref:BUD13 homolog n=1 Tax=Liquidambar formosana TaxID=63359 RepID=A0AAP0N6Z2_LIQFO